MSETRWRQISNGYQDVGRGHRVPTVGPPETIARMAQVVGVTPDQLRDAGRADAAGELELLTTAPAPTAFADDPQVDAIATLLATLPPEAQDEVLRRVGRTSQPAPAEEVNDSTARRRHAS